MNRDNPLEIGRRSYVYRWLYLNRKGRLKGSVNSQDPFGTVFD